MKTCIIKRLEQVIEGADLKRLERVLVISGHKDNHRQRLSGEMLQRLKAVHLRHLHIEENQIGRQRANARYCLRAITAFFDEFDVRVAFEQDAEVTPRQRLIINNNGSDFLTVGSDHCYRPQTPFAKGW